ncbi:MAG TPA: phosphotransferase family protein [Acidimicrobiales bacterium]|nr:phosphotransferase family protein [Acidimicrobiales bacterium]
MASLPADLVSWMEDLAGGALVDSRRQPGGARKEAWFVDFEAPTGERRELFLRYDRSAPNPHADPWTLHRESEVYLALQDTEVIVPPVLGVHGEHQAMLSERLESDGNWFSRIADPDVALRTAQHFMEQLAALHRTDVRRLSLPGFPAPTTIPAMVRWELDEWERIIDARGGDPDPQLEFAMRWLRANIPDVDGPVVLVQGDTGPGNFMYRDGRVVAVVDWELAHLGDPMDDIAWLALRSTQDPFPDFPARLREYEALVGWEVDDERVRYYQVVAETKLLVMGHSPRRANRYVEVEGGGMDVGNGLIYGVLHRRLWFEAIAALLGLDLDAPPLAPDVDDDHDWLYQALLHQLREVVVPKIADPLAQQRAKGLARIVKHLREVNLHGQFYEQGELDDLAGALGAPPADVASGREALRVAARGGKVSDAAYLQVLWRRVARDEELLRSASGALADRHWPPLR